METIEDVEFLETYLAHQAKEKAKMNERKYMQSVIGWFLIILAAALFLAFILNVAHVDASTPQLYMYLRQGTAGLDFYCASEPVYADVADMPESDYTPLALHPNDLILYAQVIAVESCNVDNLYSPSQYNPSERDGYMFAWRFTERVTDGNSANRHFTRGAAWIRLLDFEELHD